MKQETCLVTCVGSAPARAVINALIDTYIVIGIDVQDYCAGKYLCDHYVKCPTINNESYFDFIQQLIVEKNIKYIFVVHDVELLKWSNKKSDIETNFNVKVFINIPEFVEITTDKLKMNIFCMSNNIKIPKIFDNHDEIVYPAIVKARSGSGSIGTYVLRSQNDLKLYKTINNINDIDTSKYFVQEYIVGTEFTCDVLSNTCAEVLCVVPKQRIEIRNGAAFKSLTVDKKNIIEFVSDVSKKINNKYSVNIQVIENDTGIYFIELNAKYATSLPLTIASGVNMPALLIDISNNKQIKELVFKPNLLMIRHFTEYYEQL